MYRALFRPRQHPARQHPHSRRHRCRPSRWATIAGATNGDRARPAASTSRLLGIGRNGHIGFNEPFSPRMSRTRLATLDPITRRDAASDFFSRRERADPRHHDGRGHDSRSPQGGADRAGRAQGGHHPRDGRRPCHAARAGHLAARASPTPRCWLDSAAAGKLTAIATPWVRRAGRVDRSDDQAGRAVALAKRRARPCSSSTTTTSAITACTSCCAITGRPSAWPIASSAG